MPSVRSLIIAAAVVGASPALAQSFPAQPLQMVPGPTPDADALADAMRRLGTNPRDLSALIQAGELSLKLGDVTAAATLFKRADMIDPMNGRVKAGMARILVSQERPGEALRYFDQATGYGLDIRSFAGDRGLAYDLIGEHERAQRDYREALKAGANDEVQRRYALSLGIAGKHDAAVAAIDTLLRKNDRGAWRARAFILAMTGDVPGAEKIAQTMMPQGMGAALGPFFARLAALPAIDRAFAVHFGELRPTPQRLADAKLTPPLPVLAPEPQSSTQLAAAAPRPAPPTRDRRAEREEARRVQLAQRAAEKVRKREERRVALAQADMARRNARAARTVAFAAPRAVVQPLTASPAASTGTIVGRSPVQTATVTPSPASAVTRAVVPPIPQSAPPLPAPAQTAANVAAGPPNAPTPLDPPAGAATAPAPVQSAAATMPPPTPLPQPGFSSFTSAPTTSVAGIAPTPAGAVPSFPVATAPDTAPAAAAMPLPTAPLPTAPSTTALAAAAPGTRPVLGATSTAPLSVTTAPQPGASAPSVVAKMNEDSVLSRIVAGISIPATELGIAPMRPAPPPPEPGTAVATPASIASAEAARRNAETERVAQQAKAAKPVVADAKPATPADAAGRGKPSPAKIEAERKKGALARTDVEALDPKVVARKAAAERKAAEAKKLADAKKAEEKKKAAEEARLAKADPPRIWVQVAGGANESDLPKAWAAVKAKTPALAGKAAYSTPLRATNRVVTGPFKTDAEARAFINTLAKQGVSAFPFTSTKGQKMTKLGGK